MVVGIAAANGLITRVNDSMGLDEGAHPYKFTGTVAAVARSEEDFGPLAKSQEWERRTPDPKQWVWTDDYSDIVGALIRHMRAYYLGDRQFSFTPILASQKSTSTPWRRHHRP